MVLATLWYQSTGGGEWGQRGGFSSSFDYKRGFVIDQGLIPILAEMVILLYGVIQQCIADVPGRLSVVFAQNRFKLLARSLVAAVVNSIGIENKNAISRAFSLSLIPSALRALIDEKGKHPLGSAYTLDGKLTRPELILDSCRITNDDSTNSLVTSCL